MSYRRFISVCLFAAVFTSHSAWSQRQGTEIWPKVDPDRFAWVVGFSSSVPSGQELDRLLAEPDQLNAALKLLWIGCGRQDFLFERNQQFLKAFESKEIKHVTHITEGGHAWPLWRGYLHEVLPLLFQ